jgi:all-trans-retinol 13,14-reductase
MGKYDVVIIGGGLGSLLCANILSREGFNVCLVEKNRKLGGSLQTFARKACVFNTGLNYTESLDNGQVLNQYFRYFRLLDKLRLKRLNLEGFEVIHFNNGTYRFAMGQDNFVESLRQAFPDQQEGLRKYMKKIKEICTSNSLYTFREKQDNLLKNYDFGSGAADFIRSVITNDRLRNVLAGNNLLYAGVERKTPLFIHALINYSFIESAWRLVDGSHQIVNILAANIESCGGKILKGLKVEKLLTEDNAVKGAVLSNGDCIEGKYFIAGIHPENILHMVDPGIFRKAFRTRLKGLEDTMGMFTLYLVYRKNTFKYINYNFYHYNQDNVWVAGNYDAKKWPQNYLFMNNAASGVDLYAESGSVITYMDYKELTRWENTFTGHRGDDYLAFKRARAEKLLDAVEMQFPGLRSCIEAYYTSTPLTWRDYTGTRAGSAYGILKDHNRPLESIIHTRTKIPNLFLTGQNTNVHGILGVTISAVITCAELIDIRYLIRKIRNA